MNTPLEEVEKERYWEAIINPKIKMPLMFSFDNVQEIVRYGLTTVRKEVAEEILGHFDLMFSMWGYLKEERDPFAQRWQELKEAIRKYLGGDGGKQ